MLVSYQIKMATGKTITGFFPESDSFAVVVHDVHNRFGIELVVGIIKKVPIQRKSPSFQIPLFI